MSATRDAHLARIERDGFTVLPGAIEPELTDGLALDVARLERELSITPAGNEFEGGHTLRIYNLLAHGPRFARIPVHPAVLPIVEGVLDEGCLVSSLSSIHIGPGETAQPVHADDQLMSLDKPHRALVCNTMWALDDFTEANGATRVVPGSHRADASPRYGSTPETVPVEMERGSVLVWHGSLWHGGGANRSQGRRLGIAMNYCAGFVRAQENQILGISAERARAFPERLQRMLGYGVYRGLIGHVDKRDPRELLGEGGAQPMVWDR